MEDTEALSFVRIEYCGGGMHIPLEDFDRLEDFLKSDFREGFFTGVDFDGAKYMLDKECIHMITVSTPTIRNKWMKHESILQEERRIIHARHVR